LKEQLIFDSINGTPIVNRNYIIIIFAEAKVGSIVRITTMISRRLIHIVSLDVAPSGMEGIYRIIIVINEGEEAVRKLMLQIDKQVDVFKTFFDTNEEMVLQEQELYFQNELTGIAQINDNAFLACS
jgi:acetolactate synthase-1/3 small subunit